MCAGAIYWAEDRSGRLRFSPHVSCPYGRPPRQPTWTCPAGRSSPPASARSRCSARPLAEEAAEVFALYWGLSSIGLSFYRVTGVVGRLFAAIAVAGFQGRDTALVGPSQDGSPATFLKIFSGRVRDPCSGPRAWRSANGREWALRPLLELLSPEDSGEGDLDLMAIEAPGRGARHLEN